MLDLVLETHDAKSADMATKADIADVKNAVNADISDIKNAIAETKAEILKWVFGSFIALMGMLFTLMLKMPH